MLLGIEYTTKIDVWSLACVLIEMHTARPLFGAANEVSQVHL